MKVIKGTELYPNPGAEAVAPAPRYPCFRHGRRSIFSLWLTFHVLRRGKTVRATGPDTAHLGGTCIRKISSDFSRTGVFYDPETTMVA